MGEPEVVNNSEEHRFEVHVDGERAELTYREPPNRRVLVLVHTEVPEAFEGRGIGGLLVRAGVDYARERNLTIIPRCPFARSWLERHPDVADTVPIDWITVEPR